MTGPLHTVIETEIYLRTAERVMTEIERAAVVDVFAASPQAGDVILVRTAFASSASLWRAEASAAAPA